MFPAQFSAPVKITALYNRFGMGELEQIMVSVMRMCNLLVADDPPIAEKDIPVGVCRDVGFVGNDDGGDAL
jgi:hypothetical protein